VEPIRARPVRLRRSLPYRLTILINCLAWGIAAQSIRGSVCWSYSQPLCCSSSIKERRQSGGI